MPENASREPIVRLDNIVKVYRAPGSSVSFQALRGISLNVFPGDYLAIIGPSGSGKSTLMNILGCLDRPSAGDYFLDGRNVAQLDDDELSDVRGRRVGFVFQSFNLIRTMTVLQNLETPLFYQGVPPKVRHERAVAMAERVGLGERLQHRPHELSGGQQQRVAIGRSLINDPAILLADEPTGNLDSKTGELILEMLDELHAAGRTIIMVTHDHETAERCQRVVEIRDGRITELERDAIGR